MSAREADKSSCWSSISDLHSLATWSDWSLIWCGGWVSWLILVLHHVRVEVTLMHHCVQVYEEVKYTVWLTTPPVLWSRASTRSETVKSIGLTSGLNTGPTDVAYGPKEQYQSVAAVIGAVHNLDWLSLPSRRQHSAEDVCSWEQAIQYGHSQAGKQYMSQATKSINYICYLGN